MRPLSALIAVFFSVSVFIVLAAYAYPNPYRMGYLGGIFIGSFLLASFLTVVIAKIRKDRVRYDVALWLTPFLALIAIHGELIAVYDARKFVAELRAAGPGRADVWRTSQTEIAVRGRAVRAIAEATQRKIAELIGSLDDPIFDQLFDPSTTTDHRAVQRARDRAETLLRRAASAPQELDQLLEDEQDRIATELDDASALVRNSILDLVAKRTAVDRDLYRRHLDVVSRGLRVMADISSFLFTQADAVSIGSDGKLDFASADLAATYRALTERLGAVAADQNKLQAEMAAGRAEEARKALAPPPDLPF